jgi:hypothetical protein
MGVETIIGLAVAAVVLAVIGVVVATTKRSLQTDKMAPLGADQFQITQNAEGEAVPIIYGTNKIVSNILWWGNLRSEEVKEKVQGGKGGGGSQSTTTGYNYYMDIWHGLCMGPGVSLLAVLVNNDYTIDLAKALGTYTLNPGSSSFYPTEPGPYANKLAGMAHLFLDGYFAGFNTNSIPNLNFIVQRTITSPITGANMSNGTNPAAIVYDLLIQSGVEVGQINLTSFQTAADYWTSKGYGLNLVLNQQSDVQDLIAKIFTYVDGAMEQGPDGKIYLKAYRTTDLSVATLTTDDYKDFTFIRKSWDSTYNDFRANFIDDTQQYTQRTITKDNQASISLIGHKIQKTIDLSAFRDILTASKRLTEIMNIYSYPEAQVQCVVGIKYLSLRVGDIVSVSNTEYGISNASFRVINVDEDDVDNNSVRLVLAQQLETLFDDTFEVAGGTSWTPPDLDPVPLAYQKIYEIPASGQFGNTPMWWCFGARVGQEDGFAILKSINGVDWSQIGTSTTFAVRGTLNTTYPATTYTIDDETGIVFTPYRLDGDWDNLSRANLFGTNRFALIGDEIVSFQSVIPFGPTSYKLLGVIRGVLNTTIASHSGGAEIWLSHFAADDGVIGAFHNSTFYVKFVPFYGSKIVSEVSCTPLTGYYTGKELYSWAPARLVATRTGVNISVKVYPTNRIIDKGAGFTAVQQDWWNGAWTYEYDTHQYYTSYSGTIIQVAPASTPLTISHAGAFTLYVRSMFHGFTSEYLPVSIGAGDGVYYG